MAVSQTNRFLTLIAILAKAIPGYHAVRPINGAAMNFYPA